MDKIKEKSRYLSLLLRHKPEKANLTLDEFGWCSVEEVLENLNMTKEELDRVVEENNKQRFKYNEDHTKIKANQGHSIKIKNDIKKERPPSVLYHGTSASNRRAILKTGLKKMRRNHVHLSQDLETAKDVGMRYAKRENNLWIIEVNAAKMHADGFEFFLSDNNVWLTDSVPPQYLTAFTPERANIFVTKTKMTGPHMNWEE